MVIGTSRFLHEKALKIAMAFICTKLMQTRLLKERRSFDCAANYEKNASPCWVVLFHRRKNTHQIRAAPFLIRTPKERPVKKDANQALFLSYSQAACDEHLPPLENDDGQRTGNRLHTSICPRKLAFPAGLRGICFRQEQPFAKNLLPIHIDRSRSVF